MPSQKTRKQKSGDSAAPMSDAPAGPSIEFAEGTAEPAKTPERSPSKQAPLITVAQKQALIDNLQLEITERARKLRAQYALHAQGLRSRLEMRINRIPQSLRSTNIVDMIDKYAEESAPPKSSASLATMAHKRPVSKHSSPSRPISQRSNSPDKFRGTKRSSNEMSTNSQSDKENVSHEDLSLPKKRTKTTAPTATASSAASRTTRGVSRKVNPAQVLSPKSHNSRTLPRSPIKSQQPSSSSGLSSPPKSYLARPTSPLKAPSTVSLANSSLASIVANSSTTSLKSTTRGATASRPATSCSTASTATTGSLRGKRVAGTTAKSAMLPPPVPTSRQPRTRTASNSSNTSNTSSGTTIVNKAAKATAAGRKKIAGKVAGMAATAGVGKKTAVAKKENAAAPAAAAGGRTLRARR